MKRLLALHLAIGILLVAVGLWAALRPYMLLDVVLTAEEIRNPEVADAAQSLLLKGAGSDSLWMLGIGAVMILSSGIGLTRRISAS